MPCLALVLIPGPGPWSCPRIPIPIPNPLSRNSLAPLQYSSPATDTYGGYLTQQPWCKLLTLLKILVKSRPDRRVSRDPAFEGPGDRRTGVAERRKSLRLRRVRRALPGPRGPGERADLFLARRQRQPGGLEPPAGVARGHALLPRGEGGDRPGDALRCRRTRPGVRRHHRRALAGRTASAPIWSRRSCRSSRRSTSSHGRRKARSG